MTRGLILAGGLLAVGCSSDPPPIREAAPIARPEAKVAEFAPPAKPATSDPAAAKLVSAALAAHGATDSAVLAKPKSASLHRTGLTTTPEGIRAPLTCDIDASAPGQFRAAVTIRRPDRVEKFVLVITPESGSIAAPGGTKTPLNPTTLLDVRAQMAEDEFFLLYPLADPATVAVPATAVALNGVTMAGVYVWTPALAPALVHFDPKTGRIARVVYQGREEAKEVQKEISVRESQSFGGAWLPSKYELTINGRPFMDVEKQTFEIGKTFPPDHFKP